MKFTDEGGILVAGIPLIKNPIVPTGKILVGDFQRAVAIAEAKGINLRSSEFDSDNFERNLLTFRIEARIGIMVFSASSFVLGNY